MKKNRKTKANMLLKSTRIRIGKYKEKNPDVTYEELAAKFRCTFHQARNAVNDYGKGLLKQSVSRKPAIIKAIDGDSINNIEMITEALNRSISLLNNETIKFEPSEFINLTLKCSTAVKSIQAVRLQSHIKDVDAEILSIIIRKYEPEATQERILQVYHEAVEERKESL